MRGWHWMLVWVAMATAGCLEANRVTTAIDVRGLIEADILAGEYRAAADAPETARRTDPKHVSVAARLREGEVESVGAHLRVHFRHEAGHAAARVAVYAGDSDSTVYEGAPLLEIEAALEPGMERSVQREIEADPRLLQLLREDRLYFGCDFSWQSLGETEVWGRYEIDELRIEIVSTIGGLLGSSEPRPQQPASSVEDSP